MRALSIQQPWAWMILYAWKDIENRSWWTDFRGQFLIHAGKTVDKAAWESHVRAGMDLPEPGEMGLGGIVGTARIVDCVSDHPSRWFHGPYGFVLRDARPTHFIRTRGRLGFFYLPDHVVRAALQ